MLQFGYKKVNLLFVKIYRENWGYGRVSDPKTSKHETNKPGALFLNAAGIMVTYVVILIFCIKQVSEQTGNHSAEIWLKAMVDAVCISTFTYIFTQAINNLAIGETAKTFKVNICMLIADIPYILLYGVFKSRPFFLNILLCVYSVCLVLLAFYSIHLTVKKQESGQADDHTMKVDETGQKDADFLSDERSPE